MVDEAGRVIGVLGLSHDISDRKQAEAALRESETKYRLLVENSHDMIYTLSPDGILTFVSPSWTAQSGYDPAFVTGKPFRQFVHPSDVPECEAFFAKVVSTRQRQSGIEYRVINADGSVRIHTSTISPIIESDGSVRSYIGNARDITEMKQTQNAIRESNRKLNLLSSITRHDVANQLTVVQGYTQLAVLRKPEPVIADFLAKIASAVDLIQHQIEFTGTYQDLGAQAPAWHRVGDVIRSVRPPEIELVCTCDDKEIFADPMIAKVFFNLFDNAVKYGQRVTTITVACEIRADELVITFADNGIGIPLKEKQKIFEKGFGQHTGFGLFLAREILAITGISIHETGSYGRGALFEIAVPKGTYRSV
jgi:PAS domain S-box-containing protein